MSAVEEYQRSWDSLRGTNAAVASVLLVQRADAAIAELEAENARLRLNWQREAKNANRLDVELEAAEALSQARCKDCAHWIEFLGLLVGRCEAVGRFSSRNYLETPDTFVCRWWAARDESEVTP